MTILDAPASGANAIAQKAIPAPAPAAPAQHGGFSFHDLLSIVNPLQHIPVVGTLYRAITGDTIKPFDKIAGDTLYGGVIGFFSSLADTIFEKVTGKDFGDTVLSFFTGHHDSTAVASANGSSSTTAAASPTNAATASLSNPLAAQLSVMPDAVAAPDLGSLTASFSKNGIDPALARRAAIAYQRAVGLTGQADMLSPNMALQPAS